MLVIVAAEAWRRTATGTTDVGWGVAAALAARGHAVEFLLAASTEDLPPAARGIVVHPLPARWPAAGPRQAARERLTSHPGAAAVVQRDLLALMGPTTAPPAATLGRADGIVGVGLDSPHVRAIMERARGWVPTVWHVGADDVEIVAGPVMRQSLRGHRLVADEPGVAARIEVLSGLAVAVATTPGSAGRAGVAELAGLIDEMLFAPIR